MPRGVVDRQRRRALRGRAQIEVENRAVGRILAGRNLGRQRRVPVVVPPHAPRGRRREQKRRIRARPRRRDLPERRHVVQDPERAPVGRDDEIGVVNRDVVDRGRREVELQRLPAIAAIERDEHPALRAGIQETRVLRILADDARRDVGRQPVDDGLPRAAEVARAEDAGTMAIGDVDRGRVGDALVVRRRLDRPQPQRLLREEARRRHVRPGLPHVAREMNQPVRRAGPQQVHVERRGRQRDDRRPSALARPLG